MLYMAFAPPVTVFFISIAFGSIFGIIWDCFRIIRNKINNFKKIVFCLDIAYFVIISLLTILFFFKFTSGGVRLFVIIGEILGFIIYYISIEKIIFKILNLVLGSILNIFLAIFKFIRNIFLKLILISEKNCIKLYNKKLLIFKKMLNNKFSKIKKINRNK